MSAKLHLFWRVLVALFLTLLVMFGTFKLWQWQVRVDTMPGVSGEIGGFAYTPFRRDQSPLEKIYPTPEQVAEVPDSHTGRYLAPMLATAARRRGAEVKPARKRRTAA